MLLSALALLALSLQSAVALAEAPRAEPAGRLKTSLKQASRRELSVKAQFPEFFEHDKRQATGGGDDCNSSGPSRRTAMKRSERTEILEPRDVAALILGRGTYAHSNGTTVTDYEFIDNLEYSSEIAKKSSSSALKRTLKSAFGSFLLTASLPVYRHFKTKKGHADVHDDGVYMLSAHSGFRIRDLHEIEARMLADPTFVEVQVYGYRITRRWVEAAHSLD